MRPRSQSGVALITVLMIVALATVMVTLMITRQHMSVRRTSAMLAADQAWQYSLGAETIAMEVLAQDARNDAKKEEPRDSLADIWAKPWPPYPVEGGGIRGRIEDEQGKFNINLLVSSSGRDESAVVVFDRLLQQLQLPVSITPAVIDWLDSNHEPEGQDGAESDWYLRMPTPYRAANRPIADISELRLVRGVDARSFLVLRDYICALPPGTGININTAKHELLAALLPGASASQGEALSDYGGKDGYGTVTTFLDQPAFNALDASQRASLARFLDVRTRYFRITSEVTMDEHRYTLSSLVRRRDKNDLVVIGRKKGSPLDGEQKRGSFRVL